MIHRSRHRGFSLIELMVVVTVVTVLLGLCAGMIHLLLKLDHAGRYSSELAADLTRLAHDFRLDAHEATPLDPTSSPLDSLKLPLGGGRTVEYQVRPGDIVRTLREGGKVRHHDLYRRPARSTVHFEVAREGSRPFATLRIDRPPNGIDDSVYDDFRIVGELGKDQRRNGRVE